eukprot:gene4637-4838_t
MGQEEPDGTVGPDYGITMVSTGSGAKMNLLQVVQTVTTQQVGGAGSFSCVFATCGNGVVDAGEQCDDSGTQPGDGCSASCLLETSCEDISVFTIT